LDYAVNRHYDSQQGRFTQVDPIGMQSTSLASPQTLNLYAYCTNDPVNNTDPSGLGFFSWLGKLFKGIGKVLSAVGNAVGRVLNNRWVRIGVFIASFLVPFLAPALRAAIELALRIYNTAADIVSQLQLAGMLLQGKFKELGVSLGLSYVGSLVATIENGIIAGLQKALGTVKVNGAEFIDWRNFSFKKFASGVWSGFKTGLRDVANQLFRFRTDDGHKKSFWEKLANAVVPGYGNYCGPGIGLGAGQTGQAVDGVDSLCSAHDKVYQSEDNSIRLGGDKVLFRGLFSATPRLHLVDIAFGGRPSVGSTYKFSAILGFGGVIAYRSSR
jgi:RHS repeat-associated protein